MLRLFVSRLLYQDIYYPFILIGAAELIRVSLTWCYPHEIQGYLPVLLAMSFLFCYSQHVKDRFVLELCVFCPSTIIYKNLFLNFSDLHKNFLFFFALYRKWDSNPHEPFGPSDFKSDASTNSAIAANKKAPIYRLRLVSW